ncbi:hypothetical protein AB1Y20_016508 [Prymnesium parvum]|uniref:Sulfhydryl oxidase n=1 Tax=Prymnesium parvum TaxID=97485 RepID=A0AB34IA86_PRYPA
MPPSDGLYSASSPVVTLTPHALSTATSRGSAVLVEYYSAWCGHCQHFQPTYEAIAASAKAALPSLLVGAINCPSHEAACAEAAVGSFPTLVLYARGQRHVYSGGEDEASILAWAREKLPPPADGTPAEAAEATPPPPRREEGKLLPRVPIVPVPTQDIITAARQSLLEVANARLVATKQVNSELANTESHKDGLGALLGWLRALHYQLPREWDGGATAASVAELQAMLHGRLTVPKRAEWLQMLDRVNAGEANRKHEWVLCNSSNPQLHAYPCSMWLLFHSLVEHSTETTAMTTLDAIVGYVIHFFGCEECATHFAAMAATREYSLRTMSERGGRERAALWLWHAHNVVNLRLAAAPDKALAEFAKGEWPATAECAACKKVTLSHHGAKPSVGWDRKQVSQYLSLAYCLEPRFECWRELQERRLARPAAEAELSHATGLTLVAFAVFLLLACGFHLRGGGGKKKKSDHVV